MKNKNFILNKCISKVTRKEIYQDLKISQPAISKLIRKLILKNIIIEDTDIEDYLHNELGRIPKYLKLNSSYGEILCIYFNLGSIEIGLYSFDSKLLYSKHIIIKKHDRILNFLYKELDFLFIKSNILCLSIGMNGIVDNLNGFVIKSTFYNWENFNLKKTLFERYNVPIIMENGTNLIALYEKEIGLAKDNKNFLVINISNGVGAYIFFNNELYKGQTYDIGEIGHTPYDYSDKALVCSCGNKGCLETLIADWRIEQKIEKITKEKITFSEIVEKANHFGGIYKETLFEILIPLAHIIIWATSILSFEKIIIKGQITQIDSFFLKELQKKVKQNYNGLIN